jgi:predicted ArsR family transcriptional regulator
MDIANQLHCQPRTARTEHNKKKLEKLISKDQRITGRETAVQLGVGHHAVQESMEILEYQKLCSH